MKKRTAYLMILTAFVAFSSAPAAFADTISGTAGNGWQTWGLPGAPNDNGQNRSVDSTKVTGAPYWDYKSYDPGVNGDGTQMNIGWYLTNSGNNFTGGTGPGAIPFWGAAYNSTTDVGGAADPNFFFNRTSSGQSAGMKLEITAFSAANPFGWFETNSTGTTLGALHQIFSAADGPGASATFSPTTDHYGFYLTGETRGTFYTLSSNDTPYDNATFFQHFAVFKENDNTFWLGIEDLITNPGGLEDKDYNDMVVRIQYTGEFIPPTSVPEPSSMMLLGSGLLAVSIGIALRRRAFKR